MARRKGKHVKRHTLAKRSSRRIPSRRNTALRGIESFDSMKALKIGIGITAGAALAYGIYKVCTLKNLWDNLKMRFRVKIVWKSLFTDILSGNITLAVTAILENPTSGHITIQKPAITIYDGNTILAYSAEDDREKVTVNANSISEINYTFTVKANALRKFATMALVNIIEWWQNLNTANESTKIGINLNIVARVSVLGFSKNFTSEVGI